MTTTYNYGRDSNTNGQEWVRSEKGAADAANTERYGTALKSEVRGIQRVRLTASAAAPDSEIIIYEYGRPRTAADSF